MLSFENQPDFFARTAGWMTDRSITKEKVESFMSDVSNVGTKMDGKYLVVMSRQIILVRKVERLLVSVQSIIFM